MPAPRLEMARSKRTRAAALPVQVGVGVRRAASATRSGSSVRERCERPEARCWANDTKLSVLRWVGSAIAVAAARAESASSCDSGSPIAFAALTASAAKLTAVAG